MGKLFIVGTPIGNLEDITLRALRTLRAVDLVAAEDTRVTGRLLKHFEIDVPLLSFHDFSTDERLAQLLDRLETQNIALVTDAGMPGVSDPGYRLIAAATAAELPVEVIPGPTAAITALVSSGLPSDRFQFLGFLSRTAKARRAELAAVADFPGTLILYESPHRLLACLADMEAVLGDRPVAVGRELTKLYEEVWRGPISGARAEFGARDRIRGEITLVVGGQTAGADEWDEARVRAALQARLAAGEHRKKAAAAIAEISGWRKRDVYALSLED
jgi:16S rRNA (cytidine1402-2'-O)-methyltransferase